MQCLSMNKDYNNIYNFRHNILAMPSNQSKTLSQKQEKQEAKNSEKADGQKMNEAMHNQQSNQTCREKASRKFSECTDLLANYFQCLRVFEPGRLQEIRRKALQQQLQQANVRNSSAASETISSIQLNEKIQQIGKKDDLTNFTKHEKEILIQDYMELPAQNYSINQHLKFTKRYLQSYDQSYSERKKHFGYTFEQVESEREKQYIKKDKNLWQEFKRFICCRGGNYIEQLEQKSQQTDAQSIDDRISSSKNSTKRIQPSLASIKNRKQNNIFLFQDQNDVQIDKNSFQGQQQIQSTKYARKTSKQGKQAQNSNNHKGYNEYDKKSQNIEYQSAENKNKQKDARKISSRLGIDTQLLIKRKQYEQKTNKSYEYEAADNRQDVHKENYVDTFNNMNQNTANSIYNNGSVQKNVESLNANSNRQKNNAIINNKNDSSHHYNNSNNNNNNYKLQSNDLYNSNSKIGYDNPNSQLSNHQGNKKNSYFDEIAEDSNKNKQSSTRNEILPDHNSNSNNNNSNSNSNNNNKRAHEGVAKTKVDKKAKINIMINQIENQNDQQFNPNQVLFNSQDVHKDRQNIQANQQRQISYFDNNKNSQGNAYNSQQMIDEHYLSNIQSQGHGRDYVQNQQKVNKNLNQRSGQNGNGDVKGVKKSKNQLKFNNINIQHESGTNQLSNNYGNEDEDNNYSQNNYNNNTREQGAKQSSEHHQINPSNRYQNIANRESAYDYNNVNSNKPKQARKLQTQSNHLIIQQNQGNQDNGDDFYNTIQKTTIHPEAQSSAFKKKRKNKILFKEQGKQQNSNSQDMVNHTGSDHDDIIILQDNNFDNQHYTNTNANIYDNSNYHANGQLGYSYESNGMDNKEQHDIFQSSTEHTNLEAGQQKSKKNKKRRKLLVVQQADEYNANQEIVNIQNL